MEYHNIILYLLILIVFLVVFYLVISNFNNFNNNKNNHMDATNYTNNQNQNQITQLNEQIFLLKNKLKDLNNTNTTPNLDKPKEIIIETGQIDKINLNTTSNNNINSNSKPPPIIFDPIANYDIAKLTDPLVDPRGRTSADQIPTPQVAMQFNFPTQGVLDRYHRVGLLKEIDYENNTKYMNTSDSTSFKKNKTKKNKNRALPESGTIVAKSYRGIEIKENFDSDFDSDSDSDSYSNSDLYSDSDQIEYFGRTDKNVSNIYNVYSNQNQNQILELIGKKIKDNWYKYFTSITMGNKIIKVVVKNKNRRELYSGDIVYIPEINKKYRVKIDPMDMIEYNPYLF